MFFKRKTIPGLAINTYIVGDEDSNTCAVIDPAYDVNELIKIAQQENLEIKYILETHVHADFVSGSKELKTQLSNKPLILCSAMGGDEWIPKYCDRNIKDGDSLAFGSVKLKAIHTPGHTPEHICWALYDSKRSKADPIVLFSGDFLFVGSVGRPDLLGLEAQKSLAKELYKSIFEIAFKLPDFLEIFPAHGSGSLCGKGISSNYSSTIGYEKKFNPSMQKEDEKTWIEKLLTGMPPAPPYFTRMKKLNVTGGQILNNNFPGNSSISAKDFSNKSKEGIIIDSRSKETFASAHIPNSINIPKSDNFSSWVGWLLEPTKPIFLVLDNEDDLNEVQLALFRVGFFSIDGFLKGGINSWEKSGLPLSQLKTLTVQELNNKITQNQNNFFLLDVRTDSEWESGHIKEAHHIHGGKIQNSLNEIPKNTSVLVTCGSGYRASIISSILKREGFQDVANIIGGMTAWKNNNFPICKE